MQEDPEDYYIGAYWGPRKETALECARRAELFFHMLARCDPSFGQWYHAGRGSPRELPGWPVRPEVAELEKLLLKSRLRTDVDKEVIEDLGFNRIMWNAKKEPAHLHLFCGSYAPNASPNVCLVRPPRQGEVRERFLRVPVLTEVLIGMATAWDPDHAMAGSTEMVRLAQKEKGEVRIGWLTYLSRRLGTLPPLPAPVRIEPVGALGWLLVLSPEPMAASNPEHVALTVRVRNLLDRAGLIARPKAAPLGE